MEDKSNHEVTSKFAGNEFVLWKSQILSLLEAGDLSEVLPHTSPPSSSLKFEDNNKNFKNIRKLNSFSAHYNKHGSINHSKYHHNNNYANHIISQNRQQVTLVGSPSSGGSISIKETSTKLSSTSTPPSSSPLSPYFSNKLNDNASEVAAANAMVIVVRLILVILTCVLLVKLRAPRSSKRRKWGPSNRGNDDSQQLMMHDYDDDQEEQSYPNQAIYDNVANNNQRQQQHNFDSNINIDSYNKLNYSSEVDNQRQTHYKTRNLNNLPQTSQLQARRKLSQPELCSNSKSKQQQQQHELSSEQLVERRRRHSDTSLAHLKLPPGPMGLPFLGYLPFVSNEIHLTLTSLSEKYGPIYQIFLGGIRVVVLNDASLVRQAFKQPVFSGRPDTQLTRILQGYGIVNSEGALWKEQRAFLHSALRKLGAKSLMSGSNGLEAKIQNQVKEFVNDLSAHASEGKPCQVRPFVARAVSSVVGSIVMNLTYRKYEEKEKFDRLIELMQEGFRLFTIAMPLDFIPIFKFLPGVSYAYSKMKKNRAETSAFFQGVADEHRKYLSETFNLNTPSLASSLHPRSNTEPPVVVAASATTAAVVTTTADTEETVVALATVSSSSSSSSFNSTAGLTSVVNDSTSTLAKQQKLQQQKQQHQTTFQVPLTGSVQDHHQEEKEREQLRASTNNECHLHTAQQAVGKEEEETTCQQSQRQQQFLNQQVKLKQNQQKQQHVELENIVARDLVDAYIVQQKKHEKDGKENYFSDQQLVQIMSDIFSAGLETVTSTIEWSILFLILNTNCQDKIQEEIDRVIGRERLPQLEDLASMPYTEATIYEVLRRSNVVALGNAHATLDDASIGGYRIPKGTQVLPNLYGIHMNPKLWNQPDRFDPSRFIVNEKAKKPDYFIPFSVGRRMCLGDVLAKMEVFLFLVGLLQKYDLSVADEDRDCPPQVKGTIGVSNTPASFRVALKARNCEAKTTGTTNSV